MLANWMVLASYSLMDQKHVAQKSSARRKTCLFSLREVEDIISNARLLS
jgi:hypothetical protein